MAEEKRVSLGKNAVLNGFRTVLNLIFPLITFPYVSRVLQPDILGKYNYGQSVINYFLMIAALGISTYTVREGAKFRDQKVRFERFCSEVFTINMISTALSYLLLFACIALHIFTGYENLLLIFSVEIIFTTIGTDWLYTIYEDFTYITVRSIIFKLISVCLLFLMVKEPDDYLIYAGITVFSNAGTGLINFIHARKKYCRIRLVFSREILKHLRPILILFASTIATTIYVNSDVTMLGLMESDYEVGIYSAASKIYAIVKQVLSSVLLVSVPRLSMLKGQRRQEEYVDTLTQIFNVLTLLVLPAVTGLFVLSREIILLISGAAYVSASEPLRLLSIALIFCIFGWIYNDCVLIPAKKEKIVLASTIITAFINLSVNYFLIPYWHENAAAFSTIAAEGLMMIICVSFGRKEIRLKKGVLKNMISSILGCVMIVCICFLVRSLHLGNAATIILSVSLSIVSYCLVLFVLRNEMLLELIRKVRFHS